MPPPSEDTEGSRRFVSLREIMITFAGLVLVVLTLVLGRASAMVVLITSSNETLPFPDMEASFAPRIPSAGISGLFYGAYPLNACEPLLNGPGPTLGTMPRFAIVERGECKFDTKVLNAQKSGFDAVIVFNNEDGHDLISMSGSSDKVHIPAVFVSKSAGETLLEYSKEIGSRCFILPAIENTAWSVMAVSFISLLAITAVLTTFMFVRRYRLRHLGSRLLQLRDSLGMSTREVKALPSIIFKCDGESTSDTCAICLEDYESGEKLRVLPCHHDFHAACVDQWLTTRKPFCPVCKRDAHTKNQQPPPSENTPLLSAASVISVISSMPVATQTSPVASSSSSSDDDDDDGMIEVLVQQQHSTVAAAAANGGEEDDDVASDVSSCVDGSLAFHSAPDTFLQVDSDASSATSPHHHHRQHQHHQHRLHHQQGEDSVC